MIKDWGTDGCCVVFFRHLLYGFMSKCTTARWWENIHCVNLVSLDKHVHDTEKLDLWDVYFIIFFTGKHFISAK